MNLVDCDFTEYQITQTLTLSRLHASSGADKGNQTVHTHTQHVDLEQTRGIRLFNHPLERTGNPSFNLPFKAVRFVRIHGVTSWNGSMTNTAWLRSTHRRCFSCWNLVCVVCVGKPGELEQIVNIQVSQIVEEIAEVSKSLIVWSSILNLYFEEIEVFLA